MRKLVIAAALVAVSVVGCKKTGEGEYEVTRPAVGVTTDTITTPTVDVGTETTQVITPTVDIDPPRQNP